MRLLGPSAGRLAALGEAKVIAAEGVVTEDDRADFELARAQDGGVATSRYYVGLAAAQSEDTREAVIIWSRLIADAPPDAPWIDRVREQLQELRDLLKRAPPPTRKGGGQPK